jgi:predicted DNA-binding transcriptional regulator AlpA
MVLVLPQRTRFPLPVHLAADRQTWVEAESSSTALRVEQMSAGVGLTADQVYADVSTTTLGRGGDAALAAYDVVGCREALA